MYFKVRYLHIGAHITCHVFACPEMAGTYALLGNLVCNQAEFEGLQQEFRNAPFEDMELLGMQDLDKAKPREP